MQVDVLTMGLTAEQNVNIASWLRPNIHHLTDSSALFDGLVSLEQTSPDIVIIAADLLSRGAMESMEKVRPRYADLQIFAVAGEGIAAATLVHAMKMGLSDVIWLPLKRTPPESIENAFAEAEGRALLRQNDEAIVAASPEMMNVIRLLHQIAPRDAAVLIHGPVGSGRKTVARAVHHLSPRRSRPLIHTVCSAFAREGFQEQLEELFAKSRGGTLILDGVQELEKHSQTTLVMLMEEVRSKYAVRVVSIADKNLHSYVANGLFRSDLAFALAVVDIPLKPLYKRKEDLLPLAKHFLRAATEKDGKNISGFSADATNLIRTYEWPGNAHELLSAVRGAVAFTRTNEVVSRTSLSRELKRSSYESFSVQFRVGTKIRDMERDLIDLTLQFTNGDKSEAAKLLGVATRTLYRHVDRD